MPKMGVNPEQLKAAKPVPAGWYKLRIKGIVCKLSKSGKGYNYQAFLNVVENKAEFNDAFVMYQMNNGFSQGLQAQDMVHATGLVMEVDGSFPGDFKLKDDQKPDDWDSAQYNGPLLGRTVEAELIVYNFDGLDRNGVKQFKCIVDQCATRFPDIRHSTDLTGKK